MYLFIIRVINLSSIYKGISLLATRYTFLSNIILSRLTPYKDKITGNHQCGFLCKRSNILHSSYTGENSGSTVGQVHQLFLKINLKKVLSET
jgi:trans-aconitate methyltransferase